MPDEPNQDPEDRAADPAVRAKARADELRMYAELHAIFEGPRKFDAALLPGLDDQLARDIQKSLLRMEKQKSPDSPVLPAACAADAASLLKLAESRGLSLNDYHIHRRPGEAIILRWIEGGLVDAFYERMQAHFDVALDVCRDEERQTHGWKQDPRTLAYLAALDAVEMRTADRYLREIIRKHRVFVLSTITADEIDILYIAEHVMGVPAAEIVGAASAPPSEESDERERAWFFRLFSLRGIEQDVERMCFFAYLQKTEDTFDSA